MVSSLHMHQSSCTSVLGLLSSKFSCVGLSLLCFYYSFRKFFSLKSPIILEIIPTKIALLIKLASTNNITTNNYLKIKYESCQQQKISSDVAIDTRNILNLYKCECIMAWETRQPP